MSFRQEPHVAQQSRRDKLRFHHAASTQPHFDQPPMFSSSAVAAFPSAPPLPAPPPPTSSRIRGPCDGLHHGAGFFKADSSLMVAPLHPAAADTLVPLPFHSPQLYPASLHDGVDVSSTSTLSNQLVSVVQPGARPPPAFADELLLTPSYGSGQDTALVGNRGGQGLSLALSSNPAPDPYGDPDLTRGSAYGGLLQGLVNSSLETRRAVGPLGPFTGYAAVLKSSKFLRPAHQMLDEFCGAVTAAVLRPGKQWADGSYAAPGGSTYWAHGERGSAAGGGNSGGSSASLNCSAEAGGDQVISAVGRKFHSPEFQQKKAKLLYLQEEVCRRYKQYHQQMQMVVSSFESVPGLGSATPYTSLALKAISKHFRRLKNVISSQLLQVSRLLGEEFMSSPSSNACKSTTTAPRLGFALQSHPVWRPQRGLPERAIAVLRAWLFDHFLHPYPTDTDKHVLASQTGLSRNQVSNWFINARVRLWKPMVEEIHVLEMKGASGMNYSSAPVCGSNSMLVMADGGQPSGNQAMDTRSDVPLDCASVEVLREKARHNLEAWDSENRSRPLERADVDGNLTSYGAYSGGTYSGGTDIGGGFGAVSLTLGLRHDGAPQQQQHMRHFKSQM